MIFGSTALEVAIGMIFVYLLMSLLCSAAVEYVEAKANYRAKDLKRGIRLLLDEHVPEKVSTGETVAKANEALGKVEGAVRRGGDALKGVDEGLAERLYKHPLVKSLYRGDKLPSYIPSRTFALALWDMAFPAEERAKAGGDTKNLGAVRGALSANTVISDEVKRALLALIDDAQGDFDKARGNVEDWYDGTMDRVSGWYKRRVHVILLFVGFAVAAFVNADSINIAKALMQNDALRASIVAAAEKAPAPTTAPTPTDPAEQSKAAEAKFKGVRSQLDALGLPLGWIRDSAAAPDDMRRLPATFGGWLLKFIGIALTALAVSQGAPFWFDLLNKFMVVRSTVKPHEKSREEGTKGKESKKPKKRDEDDEDEGHEGT